jgi:hypothetical protein
MSRIYVAIQNCGLLVYGTFYKTRILAHNCEAIKSFAIKDNRLNNCEVCSKLVHRKFEAGRLYMGWGLKRNFNDAVLKDN